MRLVIQSISVIIIFVITACGTSKRMNAAKTTIASAKESQQQEQLQANGITSLGSEKLKLQNIDSNINSRLTNKMRAIQQTIDSVNEEIAILETLSVDKRNFKSANYRKIVVPKLEALKLYNNQKLQRTEIYMMLQDVLDVSAYTLFDLAAFFGPGKYIIPEEKTDLARKAFAPLVDSIIKFSNKYKEVPRNATLVILGFADATGYAEGSPIYNMLLEKTGKNTASKEELNQKISELRAEELIRLLTVEFVKKNNDIENINALGVEYLGRGKGEQLPLVKITDYKTDDERRRVVLCYWAVLPK